jgi:hypothetical protein
MDELSTIMEKLASRSVLERKSAIRQLSPHLHRKEAYLARLSLHYISQHDPAYTVRNIARQAFYRVGEPPSADGVWDKAYAF